MLDIFVVLGATFEVPSPNLLHEELSLIESSMNQALFLKMFGFLQFPGHLGPSCPRPPKNYNLCEVSLVVGSRQQG